MFSYSEGRRFVWKKTVKTSPMAQGDLQLLLTPSRTDLPLPYSICALASKRKNSVFTKIHF